MVAVPYGAMELRPASEVAASVKNEHIAHNSFNFWMTVIETYANQSSECLNSYIFRRIFRWIYSDVVVHLLWSGEREKKQSPIKIKFRKEIPSNGGFHFDIPVWFIWDRSFWHRVSILLTVFLCRCAFNQICFILKFATFVVFTRSGNFRFSTQFTQLIWRVRGITKKSEEICLMAVASKFTSE